MFGSSETHELKAKLAALDKSQAVIEFNMDGTIITANKNFLDTLGYTLEEIKGKHHSMFVDSKDREGSAYQQFWESLNRGEYCAAEYRRIGKGGREVWIQASYNPIMDINGKPFKVVKFATDTTARKLQDADNQGQLTAINLSQAVIEFNMNGTIIKANDNFLNAMGYRLDEIVGKHHSIFVDDVYRQSREYKEFWEILNQGKFHAGQYKRFTKGGREIWIEATYNPIFDAQGKLVKIVKYATDVTAKMELIKVLDNNLGRISKEMLRVKDEVTSVSTAAIETSGNIQTVAAGAEELNASVEEITRSMMNSKQQADNAYDRAMAADTLTGKLTDATNAMTGIVKLIQDIASQVNLLSLNATIEAARAGDAGKGFAVVANEVKNLAKQAADATEQITKEIQGVQSVSGDVVGALKSIQDSINSVRDYVSGTAAAVEEQSAVARDMSSNMQTASKAVDQVSNGISGITESIRTINDVAIATSEAKTKVFG